MEKTLFGNYLGEKGLRLTKERDAVLGQVFAFHGHFGPEELYDRIRQAGIKASRASVYRTLNLLVSCGLVERVTQSGKGNVYEHTYGHRHHDHMICTGCGTFIEFYSPELEKLQQLICKKQRFLGTSHTLEIRGVCSLCRK